ncbi:MAG: alpha/beta hydrolase [Pseudonocardia sp.]|nr:alpha/beta hydrolase [Pseudonocardia sp.]
MPTTPAWFATALESEADVAEVEVSGVPVRFRAWGPTGGDGVVLIHGGAAHARWWDHIAPLLAEPGGRRVAALDLSGHGDSGRRPAYTLETWADEALAVADAAGAGTRPVIVGHSMGGMVALTAARRFGERLAGAVAIDTPVRERPPEHMAARERRAFGPLKRYATREEAIARFRTVPPQEDELPYVMAHIAEHSVRRHEDSWVWKFDPMIFNRWPLAPGDLDVPGCRVGIFRAQHGLVPADMGEMIVDKLGRGVPVVEIPTAAHHVMIDNPIALVTGLRTLLGDWRHSHAARPDATVSR